MGIDLRLLPFDGSDFSHTVLSCERTYELFDEIKKLESLIIDVPKFNFYGADGYGFLRRGCLR